MKRYKRLMRNKFKLTNNNHLSRRFINCFASLDGKRFSICRPSGINNQQAAVYNNYYKTHNLGCQGITAPDGMIIQMSGPYAGADNDLDMLHRSKSILMIRRAIMESNVNLEVDLVADKIYNIAMNGIASLPTNPRNKEEEEENAAASTIRIPVEWSFGKIVILFPLVDFKKKLKINEREIGLYIIVATILTNIHTCLYGSQTSSYFSSDDDIILPPTLEEYMVV
jgi:hypothetical protein